MPKINKYALNLFFCVKRTFFYEKLCILIQVVFEIEQFLLHYSGNSI